LCLHALLLLSVLAGRCCLSGALLLVLALSAALQLLPKLC
jgi:hypothetical protein